MKFREKILNSFQVIEWTQNDHSQISKGNNSKNVDKSYGFLWCAWRLMMLYVCRKCHENILNGFHMKLPLSNSKGNNSKNV